MSLQTGLMKVGSIYPSVKMTVTFQNIYIHTYLYTIIYTTTDLYNYLFMLMVCPNMPCNTSSIFCTLLCKLLKKVRFKVCLKDTLTISVCGGQEFEGSWWGSKVTPQSFLFPVPPVSRNTPAYITYKSQFHLIPQFYIYRLCKPNKPTYMVR